MACWGTELWWNRGAGRKLRFVLGCDSFHARFVREFPPVFVHMLLRPCVTDDRESPSGRPSSNIYIYIYIYIYISACTAAEVR